MLVMSLWMKVKGKMWALLNYVFGVLSHATIGEGAGLFDSPPKGLTGVPGDMTACGMLVYG